MSALPFILTSAGQTLLAQASTIGPVTITAVKTGSAAYTATSAATGLTSPLATQPTIIGSSTPGGGIIHITAQDNSTSAYNVYEIGLYAGTTLFAIYAQTTAQGAILSKSSGNVAMFSIDLALTNVPSGSVTIGSATFTYPPATESTAGVAQIATTAQVTAGTDNTTIVTPLKLANAAFVKRAGDTMTGALVLPSATASKSGATIVTDPNYASSGNAYVASQGSGAFYIGTNDAKAVGLYTTNLVRITVNADGSVNFNGGLAYNSPTFVPTGLIGAFGSPSAPSGWIFCNGSAISRTAYAALFAAIGTYWGVGDGSSTFNLPDFRGEFLRGWDAGRGVDSGRTFGAWQNFANQLPNTTNNATFRSLFVSTGRSGDETNGVDAVSGMQATYGGSLSAFSDSGASSISRATITTASETRPRNQTGYICIKY